MRRTAFTLVELLVVIGIIAVLVSILLPSLGRARQAANRAACLSNLRQIHMAYHIYANDNNDYAPLGNIRYGPDELITSHQYQYNYVMYRGSSGQFIIFGCLYNAGLLTSGGKAWYCPSITDGGTAYDTPSNPWPPKSTNDPTQDTRMGYGSRPGWGWRTPTSTDNGYPTKRPRLSQMKNRAIFADIFSVKADIVRRHKDGLNVLYGNGAAKWVPYSVIQEEMELVQQITGGTFSPTVNTFFLDNTDPQVPGGMWGKFDRY